MTGLRSVWRLVALALALSPLPSVAEEYVSSSVCKECHHKQYDTWLGSHHQQAMQHVSRDTVLGDFDNARLSYNGVTSRFFKRGEHYFVNTDGPDGELRDYQIKYTFGVTPLQQYLVELPGGRLQALSIAWDARAKAAGGQRWFHLYAGQRVSHDHELHWTGRQQNWNFMCAACHSTNVRKGHDAVSDSYQTTWSEINVACEACHGPGGDHVSWARWPSGGRHDTPDKGFRVRLSGDDAPGWQIDGETGNALPRDAARSDGELNVCARCHARRSTMVNDGPGTPFLDTHMPALISERLYHPDGQIREEVYVYGSFLQSKMHSAGVACSDCHDVHSLKLKTATTPEAVCQRCHVAEKYADTGHHRHEANSPGASCFACHMPERTYMGVDRRRDHSIRIPRPDLSVSLGTPNACNQCHDDQSPQWAAQAIADWFPAANPGYQGFAEALAAARAGNPAAEPLLMAVVSDANASAIARATAVAELINYLSPAAADVVQSALHDPQPLVRLAAVANLELLAPKDRHLFGAHLLSDARRAVRVEAARVLADTPPEALEPRQREALARAVGEYIAMQQLNAERPESQLNLGLLYTRQRDFEKALIAYQQALKLEPRYSPAVVNLADVYRLMGREQDAEQALRSALQRMPGDATLYHALGLSMVRQNEVERAVIWLKMAAALQPENPRFEFVYAAALNSTGRPNDALKVLQRTHQRYPHNRDILIALIVLNREQGALQQALVYARKLVEVSPSADVANQILHELSAVSH